MNNPIQILKKIPLGHKVSILNYDHNTTLFALNKPEGIRSHPNEEGIDKKSLLLAPYDPVKECYLCDIADIGRIPIFLLNRLDAPTSGVILLCLDARLVPEIHKLFKTHKVKKTYYAIIKGRPATNTGIWNDLLISQHLGKKLRTEKGDGRLAKTSYRLISQNDSLGISLCQLQPITGLTHQLRVQKCFT